MPGLGSALHYNEALTNYAISWKPRDPNFFFSSLVLPYLPVEKDSNVYRSISKARMLQLYEAAVGTKGKVQVIEFGIGPDTKYKCLPYSLEGHLNHYERQQADSVLQYEKQQTFAPRFALQMALEKKGADLLTTSGNYGGNTKALSAAEMWDDYGSASSSPIDELITALEKITTEEGVKANVLCLDKMVWRVVSRHPGVLRHASVHAEGRPLGFITVADLEKILGEWIEPGSIHVIGGRYNATQDPSDDGASAEKEDLRSFIGDNVVMAYVEPPSPESIGFGHTFATAGTEDGQGGHQPMVVHEFDEPRMAPRGGTVIRLMSSVDQKITRKASGYLLRAVVDKTAAQYNNKAGNSQLTAG